MTTDMKPELETRVRTYFQEQKMDVAISPRHEAGHEYLELTYDGMVMTVQSFPNAEYQVIRFVNGKGKMMPVAKSIDEVIGMLPALYEKAA